MGIPRRAPQIAGFVPRHRYPCMLRQHRLGPPLQGARRRIVACCLLTAILSVSSALVSGSIPTSAASPTTTLSGRQIPGTTWAPFKMSKHTAQGAHIAFSLGPDITQVVYVVHASSASAASKLYSNLATLAKFEFLPISLATIRDPGPVASPSRWLAIKICVVPQSTTPTTQYNGSAPPPPPVGAPVGAPTASGHCHRGVASVNGIEAVVQRGRNVAIVVADGVSFGGPFTVKQVAALRVLSDNIAMTKSVLSMLPRGH